jgi:hypothetical protein
MGMPAVIDKASIVGRTGVNHERCAVGTGLRVRVLIDALQMNLGVVDNAAGEHLWASRREGGCELEASAVCGRPAAKIEDFASIAVGELEALASGVRSITRSIDGLSRNSW